MQLLLFALLSLLSLPFSLACNGNPSFCNLKYSNVSLIGTHDSPFVGPLPTQNQELEIPQQLDAGIRFLQAQTQSFLGQLRMCHTSCFLEDAGTLQGFLETVKDWLEAEGNEQEVVTLLITNGDYVDVSEFKEAFEGSGLGGLVFVPDGKIALESWPTLGEMVEAGKRVVVFLDYEADTKAVPYILPEWDYFFETPYDTTDKNFPQCALDRPPSSSPDGKMYIVNHFLDMKVGDILIPNKALLGRTNAATGEGSIGAQADLCNRIYGRKPDFVLVDFFDTGDVFAAQNALNGL